MDVLSSAILGATAVATGAYLNAKFGLGADLKQLRYDREWGRRLGERIGRLGDRCSLFGVFDAVEEESEALWFEGRTWSYGELKSDVLRLVAYLEAQGVKRGDYFAVFMTNSPEMIVTILALSKIGAVAGLININLRDDTLKHCLDISTAQTVISTPDLSTFIKDSKPHFSLNLGSFTTPTPTSLFVKPITSSSLPHPTTITPAAKATPADISVLIFTSGTTGKPKACAILNNQILVTSNPLTQDLDAPSTYFPLRTYSPLPLFHGTALFTLVCYSIGTGSTMCLARKFSSSRFFKDVHDSRATRILYVGELCRYLVNSPPTPWDRDHSCVVATGNGLRAEIWERFRERFGVPEIREFYRSTEGFAKYDNFGRGAWGAGKIGFSGPLRRRLENDTVILRLDAHTAQPYRDPVTGLCVRAQLGEVGEVAGRVKNRALLTAYLNNAAATEEKLLRDVLARGDLWQKMGDLLVQDREGWVRFHDRMGDTFRWKGENVSAGEVRDHLAKLEEVVDAVVWGARLDGYDGQAGAAALTLNSASGDEAFMSALYDRLKATGLPDYALPRLVRITKEIEANATFKKSKVDMAKKSWAPGAAGKGVGKGEGKGDVLFWLDGKTYRRLDQEGWRGIESGRAKL